jgi:protein ImuB
MPAVLPRLAVIHCPQWPVMATGCSADDAVAVVHANKVVARSRVAAAAGVRVGQRRREAQSRCPNLQLIDHEPAKDARAFNRVAEAVAEVVPRLELTVPGVLTFAVRGPSRYFGGDAALALHLDRLLQQVIGDAISAVGRPGVGIADGRFAATVAARGAVRARCPQVIDIGGSPGFLAPLPLQWLIDAGGMPADQVDLFARLGLRCLGDLAALPEPDVLARFGFAGVAAHRMASGRDDRPAGTEDPPVGLMVVQEYDTPVHHLDSLVFGARQLVEQLVGTLADRGLVCTQFAVVAETEHGECNDRLWSLSTGFGVNAMAERLRWQLDGWARGVVDHDDHLDHVTSDPTSGVVRLSLEPTEVRADHGVQLGLWGGRSQADEWAQRAATRLAGLIGDEHVVVAEWRGGRRPADLDAWVPASLSSMFDDAASRSSPTAATGAPWPGRLPSPSPAVVHPEPLPCTVVDQSGTGITVSGRGVASGSPAAIRVGTAAVDAITAWAGPWVLEERWWDPARSHRAARFQFVTATGRAYVASIERQRWWLVAEYG